MTNTTPYLSYETDHTKEVVYLVGNTYVVAGWDKQANPKLELPGSVFLTTTEKLDERGNWDWTEEDLNRNPNVWHLETYDAWQEKQTALVEELK